MSRGSQRFIERKIAARRGSAGAFPSKEGWLLKGDEHGAGAPPDQADDQTRGNAEYPAIALCSGIEAAVITVLKEDPPERGFAEAAVNAFRDIRAVPAEADGTAVGAWYRYPVRFKITR